MKYIATVAMASALALAAGAALADPNTGGNGAPPHHDAGGKGDQKGGPKGGQGGGQGGSQGSGGSHTFTTQGGAGQGNGQGGNGQGGNGQNHFRGPTGQFSTQSGQGGNGQGNGQGGNGQNHFRGPTGQFNPQGGNGQGGNGRGGHGAPGFVPGNHSLRPQDRGRVWFSVNLFPHNYHVNRRYHYRPYNYPRGWYQQNWGYGQFLPYGWYDQQYYLDWNYFGLPNPPIGCEWVRVGNDALLVDVWSGEVLSVSSGLFW